MKFLRGEDGFTLVELMMVSVLSLIILASALSLLDGATRTERGLETRLEALQGLRQAMTETTRSVRQATAISSTSTTSSLVMDTFVDGTTHHMIYDVAANTFRVNDTTVGGGPRVIASNVATTDPFCYDPPMCVAPSPVASTSIRITLSGQPAMFSTGQIKLSSDVELRNIP